jgi:hypothetical protein
MVARHPKLFMIIFLFLGGFVSLLFGCILALFTGDAKPTGNNSISNTPLPNIVIRAITITINPERRDELFAQLEDFADEWRYAVLIAPTDSSENEYIVKLYRIDMKMTGSYDADTGVLELDFYQTNAMSKYHPPERYFDDELVDLKRLINEIPNSTYSVQK